MKAKDAGLGRIVGSKPMRVGHKMNLDQLEQYVRGEAQAHAAVAEAHSVADPEASALRASLEAEAATKLAAAADAIKLLRETLTGIVNAVSMVVQSKQCPVKMKPGLQAIVNEAMEALK